MVMDFEYRIVWDGSPQHQADLEDVRKVEEGKVSLWILTWIFLGVSLLAAAGACLLLKRANDRVSAIASLDSAGPTVCYRCAAPAVCRHMGIDYCFMCREVVVTMMSAVSFDPPFGFPGAPGYLEAPKEVVESAEEGGDRGR